MATVTRGAACDLRDAGPILRFLKQGAAYSAGVKWICAVQPCLFLSARYAQKKESDFHNMIIGFDVKLNLYSLRVYSRYRRHFWI